VLSNEHTTITLRHQRLQLLGLDDSYTGHTDRDRATRGLRPDLPVLGLSHIAEEADGLWRCGVPLVLSGHTHGGQVTFARLHEIMIGRLSGHKYIHGLYGTREAAPRNSGLGAVYVGAGIGSAVIPFRIGERARREVTVFELGIAPGAFHESHGEQVPLQGRKPSPFKVARRAAADLPFKEDSWINGYDPEFARELGRRGWIGMTWPREYGGGARSYVERAIVTEGLLRAGAPTAAHWVGDRQIGPALLAHGNEEQKRAILPRIVRGELVFCLGMSEPGAGSDLASLQSTATRGEGGWLLNGQKTWISNAGAADFYTVLCREGEGFSTVLVPADSPA
jgi:hypothetical protein